MDEAEPTRKRLRALRATAACEQCRRSKIKCNGQSPCEKCAARQVECVYRENPVDPVAERFEALESRVAFLETQLANNVDHAISHVHYPLGQDPVSLQDQQQQSTRPEALFPQAPAAIGSTCLPDIVLRTLLSEDEARDAFGTFFRGCHRFVPIFDDVFDTFDSVRQRSSILFDTICTVGCRSLQGQNSPAFRRLSNELKKRICEVILRKLPDSIETIQALLLISSYWERGFLMTSLAVRMSVDLGLQERLRNVLVGPESLYQSTDNMRRARVWLGAFNLDLIFSIDGGKEPSWMPTDEIEGRKCRALLDYPGSTALDARLIAQVELNIRRIQAHQHISTDLLSDASFTTFVRNLKLDAEIWYRDWERIALQYPADTRTELTTAFSIIKSWAEIMVCCKLIQHLEIENIDAMSFSEREVVMLAFQSAREHLGKLILHPRSYLASFSYAMEFVHAKCAFSILLVLKLATLLQQDLQSAISNAEEVLKDLVQAQGPRNVYTRIIEFSIDKAHDTLNAMMQDQSPTNAGSVALSGRPGSTVPHTDEGVDLQTYVPNEFVFEWNFPGLTLFSVPLNFQSLFTDLAMGI